MKDTSKMLVHSNGLLFRLRLLEHAKKYFRVGRMAYIKRVNEFFFICFLLLYHLFGLSVKKLHSHRIA
jgi:hypothetical protein